MELRKIATAIVILLVIAGRMVRQMVRDVAYFERVRKAFDGMAVPDEATRIYYLNRQCEGGKMGK